MNGKNGVGARKVHCLPAAPLGGTKAEGEPWSVGGKQAFAKLKWEVLGVGESMAARAIGEWLGVDSAGSNVQ